MTPEAYIALLRERIARAEERGLDEEDLALTLAGHGAGRGLGARPEHVNYSYGGGENLYVFTLKSVRKMLKKAEESA